MNLNIPDSKNFLINLVLQRTSPLINLGHREVLLKWIQTGKIDEIKNLIEDKFFLEKYLKILLKEISLEADNLIKVFKNFKSENLVSIGPGNGLIELILLKKLPIKKILLIDIEKTDTHHHGFYEKGSGYAKLEETKNFFIKNGIKESSINCCNPNNEALPIFRIDILISLISMGFHYPCDDYYDFIINNSKPKTVLSFDKRKVSNDSGYENLIKKFKILGSIESTKKNRVFLIKEN